MAPGWQGEIPSLPRGLHTENEAFTSLIYMQCSFFLTQKVYCIHSSFVCKTETDIAPLTTDGNAVCFRLNSTSDYRNLKNLQAVILFFRAILKMFHVKHSVRQKNC